jgi:hypothetical protein
MKYKVVRKWVVPLLCIGIGSGVYWFMICAFNLNHIEPTLIQNISSSLVWMLDVFGCIAIWASIEILIKEVNNKRRTK